MDRGRRHLHEALRECAERGVPNSVDLWPEVRKRLFAYSSPALQEADLIMLLGQRRTIDGVSVVLDRAYADANHVLVGFAVEGLSDLPYGGYVTQANLYGEGGMRFEKAAGGHGISWGRERLSLPKGSRADIVLFDVPKGSDAHGRRRFRLEVEVHGLVPGTHDPREGMALEPVLGPFVYDFELPVHPVSVLPVNQREEAGGLTLTLDRVENSPARTRAFICFDPPDDESDWMPVVRTGGLGRYFGRGRLVDNPATKAACSTFTFKESLYGRPGDYRLTVTEILGIRPAGRGAQDTRALAISFSHTPP